MKTPKGGLVKGKLYELVVTTKSSTLNYGYTNDYKGFKPIAATTTNVYLDVKFMDNAASALVKFTNLFKN